ncbi:hypothetical protein [Deinococcus aestuarii]|uniref:hypothetical protein n=1 Tax=Deinococcus aestuarii TaxID=2774531 RepID=UPI001C0BCE9D|nr:hypothetical protein [Deinococcus aestuarii]
MSVLLLLLLLGASGWAVSRRSGRQADSAWKTPPPRNGTLGGRSFPNRAFVRGRSRTRLLPAPFRPGEIVRVDGEWYHLPTLRRLHRDGCLGWGSPGWRALEQAERGRRLN